MEHLTPNLFNVVNRIARSSIIRKIVPYRIQKIFLFSCLLNDNYDKKLLEQFAPCMMDSPYGYTDAEFDVTVKENDIVIDAGAWIGDFSAYAASKGAAAYAFEPVSGNYEILAKTAALNSSKIIPIKTGRRQ